MQTYHDLKNPPLSIQTAIPNLLLMGVQGHEGISQLYQFRLDLLAANDASESLPPVPFEKLLGQEAAVTIRLDDRTVRRFSGIIARLTQGARDGHHTVYQADLVPRLWLRTKRIQSRIFQQKTVREILQEVLAGLDVIYLLTSTYEPRDYCTQYQESDFAFVSRLMEEEGIFYYFRHGKDGHQLVISDQSNYSKLPVEQADGKVEERTTGFPFAPGGKQNQEGVRIWEWSKTQEVCAGSYTLWDHHFELPTSHLERRASVVNHVKIGKVDHGLRNKANADLEVFEYPGGYAEHFDGVGPGGADQAKDVDKVFPEGQRIADRRVEEEAAHSLMIQGAGNCGQLLPGFSFSLLGHFDANDAYLVTRVEHRAAMTGYRSGEDRQWEYSNRFACLPGAMPYRPRRLTPRPVIHGTQTATVTGVPDQPTFLDKYGRVKVQFHWDRQGKLDAKSSCWVRVAQIWAGKRWGAFFWPRVGHEVVVSFDNGDPDCPLIVGSVYNAVNLPPVDLPMESAFGGIKSCIIGADPTSRFNSLVFFDAVGMEFAVLHSHNLSMYNNVRDDYSLTPGASLTFSGKFPGMDL